MRLEDLEKLMLSNLDEFLNSCSGICRSDIPYSPSLSEHSILDGCGQCLLRNLMDSIDVESFNIILRDGNYLEFFRLDDVIVEIGNDVAFIIPLDEFISRIRELREFNIISDEDVESLTSWFRGSG
ncbi:MAG: hypothetical protein QXY36_03285 [Sulfolobales archaeon]